MFKFEGLLLLVRSFQAGNFKHFRKKKGRLASNKLCLLLAKKRMKLAFSLLMKKFLKKLALIVFQLKEYLVSAAYSDFSHSQELDPIKAFSLEIEHSKLERPHYGYICFQAAQLAKRLGKEEVSVLEFGVASGNGLLLLERYAKQVGEAFNLKVHVYGFDTGEGLPSPVDYRDLPYHWQEGFFKMDFDALKLKMSTATLILGDIAETLDSFFDLNPSPIGGIVFDLDYYSSTVNALKVFEKSSNNFLPRVFTYFDDTVGSDIELYGDYTGERLAISEFNSSHSNIKLSPPYYLHVENQRKNWHIMIWICHLFNHPEYNKFISKENQNIPLN